MSINESKIKKLTTVSLINKVKFGNFQGEDREFAISLLKKRNIDVDEILMSKDLKPAELEVVIDKTAIESPKEVVVCEASSELITEPVSDSVPTDLPIKPVKEKKTKPAKKSGKREKKIYIDEKGKEMTKSDLMRRLIRLKHSIKPKELNDQLIAAGFEKAYHSEIQRCRQQMGVTPEVKE